MEPITAILAGITLATRLADLLASIGSATSTGDLKSQIGVIQDMLSDAINDMPEGSPLRLQLQAAKTLLASVQSVGDATGIIARVQGLILWATGAQLGNPNSPAYIETKAIADRVAAGRLALLEMPTTNEA